MTEKDLQKWKGTGYEDDIFKEYMNPTTKPKSKKNSKKEKRPEEINQPVKDKQKPKVPLFEKSEKKNVKGVMTLDGFVGYEDNTA